MDLSKQMSADDIDKLDPLTDGFVHYQLLRFCQATRLQYLNAHVPKYDLTSYQQAQVDITRIPLLRFYLA